MQTLMRPAWFSLANLSGLSLAAAGWLSTTCCVSMHCAVYCVQVAEEVESQLQKYKAAVDEINAKTGGDHDADSNGEHSAVLLPGVGLQLLWQGMPAHCKTPEHQV